ncbi:OmpA family protein [Jiulongibacter sp. NS-SX5]|uniref:OmpA family protein n=1 Tax=Jiulongibacter sp. NS-SX5 TaxID=3463854 RepID=UPI0040588393
MKNLLVTLLFICVASDTISQLTTSRFSLSPHFGLGMRSPGIQTVQNGSERMAYLWKFYNFGRAIGANGQSVFSFNTTNKISLDLEYQLLDRFELFTRIERVNLLTAYQSSLEYEFKGNLVGGFYDTFTYMNYGLGFRAQFYNLYFTLGGGLQPTIFKNSDRKALRQSGSSSPFVNTSGTGLDFNYTKENPQNYNIMLGLGQNIELFNGPGRLEFGLNISPKRLYKETIDFYRESQLIGTTQISHTSNAFFVSLAQTLPFRQEYAPQGIEEEYVIGEDNIEPGETLILEAIKFEQSKSDLTEPSKEALHEVYAFMLDYPDVEVLLAGHTSKEGSRRENMRLSEERAEACKNYLVSLGIEEKRITVQGFGPRKPISIIQEQNRRVELSVLK